MAEGKPLGSEQIDVLLAGGRADKADPTATRDITTWFKLNHYRREEGCSNPDCVDPRPEGHEARFIVAEIRGKYLCRHCFFAGYLKTDEKLFG
jgi:hypothetical protein